MSLKQILNKNKLSIGCWITISNQLIPEILSPAGFDWFCVDLEHTSIGLDDLMSIIVSIENQKITPLVRVGENNPNLIKRVMDIGAHGVIVPNILTASEAKKAVESVKYPPSGNRGVGLYRAQGFGRTFTNYLEWLEKESIVIIQIESIEALPNIDEIFSVKGIDAFLIGPYDLSGSMNKPGDFDDPEFKESIKIILEAAKKHNIPAGYHSVSSNPDMAIEKINEGYKFLAFSLDSILLQEAAINSMNKIKQKI